jgi:hypothetical protein
MHTQQAFERGLGYAALGVVLLTLRKCGMSVALLCLFSGAQAGVYEETWTAGFPVTRLDANGNPVLRSDALGVVDVIRSPIESFSRDYATAVACFRKIVGHGTPLRPLIRMAIRRLAARRPNSFSKSAI